eukprot:CAMPEP_0174844086 /NCGR_PEP_ID=MMETSP1114-20130205/10898_1 /TAXON_ID=312471 /ORGANISM="Neobodo designis, Strain CCAP 1951/1" /LENGTH=267 /DNA_ID=CAMNT_0016078319 /DNA_START=32 /DNA_END=832 /DNA_ORIENTATION=+
MPPNTTGKVPAPPPSAAAAAADAVRRAAAENGAPKRKRRMRPIGIGLIEKVSPAYLVGFALLLYAFGQFLSHPLDDLRGTEQRLDVVRVVDGDTFFAKVQPHGYAARFRLKRVDAPELDQPLGNEAREALERLLIGDLATLREAQHTPGVPNIADSAALSDVEVVALLDAQDEWGRYIVDVVVRTGLSTNTTYVQRAMVEDGFAWTLSTFNRHGQLKVAMDNAKEAKRGIWGAEKPPVEPWKHRWQKRGENSAGAAGAHKDQRAGAR